MNPELKKILASVVKGERDAYLTFKQKMADLKGGCSVKQFVLYLCGQKSLDLADPEALVDMGFFIAEGAWILNESILFDTVNPANNFKFDPDHFVAVLKQAAQTNPGALCALMHLLKSLDIIQQYCPLPLDPAVEFGVFQRLLEIAKVSRQANDPMRSFFNYADALICASLLAGPVDYKKACAFLRESQLPAAHCLLGKYYDGVNGVRQDPAEALKHYRGAAKELHPYGLFYVAWNLHAAFNGDYQFTVHAKDEEQFRKVAFDSFQAAAAQGYPDAEVYLGQYYETGCGLNKKCYRNALTCYLSAGRQNFPHALYRLGKIYEKGYCGVDKDLVKAIKFYRAAAACFEYFLSAYGAMMLLCLEPEYNTLPENMRPFTTPVNKEKELYCMVVSAKKTVDAYPEDAIYQFDKIIKKHPKSFAAYLGRAEVHLKFNDPTHIKQMVTDLKKAAELANEDPLRKEFRKVCVEIAAKIENNEIEIKKNALIDFYTIMTDYVLDVMQDCDEYYKYILLRATICDDQNRLKEAIQYYSIYLIEYDSENSEVYRYRGNAYRDSNWRDLAQVDYRMAQSIEKRKKEANENKKNTRVDKKVGAIGLSSKPELVDEDAKTVIASDSDSNSSFDETAFTDCLELVGTIQDEMETLQLPDKEPSCVAKAGGRTKQLFNGMTESLSIVQAVAGEFCSVSKLDPINEDQHIYVVLFKSIEDIVTVLENHVNHDLHAGDFTLHNLIDLKAVVINTVAKLLATYYGQAAIDVTAISIILNITKTPHLETKGQLEKKRGDLKQAILHELPEYQAFMINLRKQQEACLERLRKHEEERLAILRKQEEERLEILRKQEEERQANLRKQEFEQKVSSLGKMESRCLTFETHLKKVCAEIHAYLQHHAEFLANIDILYLERTYKKRPKHVNTIYDLLDKLRALVANIEKELKQTNAEVAQGQADIQFLKEKERQLTNAEAALEQPDAQSSIKQVTEEAITILRIFFNKAETKHDSVSALYRSVKEFSYANKLAALSREITKYKSAQASARTAQQKLLQASMSVSTEELADEGDLVDDSGYDAIHEHNDDVEGDTPKADQLASDDQQSPIVQIDNKDQKPKKSKKAKKDQHAASTRKTEIIDQQSPDIETAKQDRQPTDSQKVQQDQQPKGSKKAKKDRKPQDSQIAKQDQQSTNSPKTRQDQLPIDSQKVITPQQSAKNKKIIVEQQATDTKDEIQIQRPIDDQKTSKDQLSTNDQRATIDKVARIGHKEIQQEESKDSPVIIVDKKPTDPVHTFATTHGEPVAIHDLAIKPPVIKQPARPRKSVPSTSANQNAQASARDIPDKSLRQFRPNGHTGDALSHKSRVVLPTALQSYQRNSRRSPVSYKPAAPKRHQVIPPTEISSAHYKAAAIPPKNSRETVSRQINATVIPRAPQSSASPKQISAYVIPSPQASEAVPKQNIAPAIPSAYSSGVVPKQNIPSVIPSAHLSEVVSKQNIPDAIPPVHASDAPAKQPNIAVIPLEQASAKISTSLRSEAQPFIPTQASSLPRAPQMNLSAPQFRLTGKNPLVGDQKNGFVIATKRDQIPTQNPQDAQPAMPKLFNLYAKPFVPSNASLLKAKNVFPIQAVLPTLEVEVDGSDVDDSDFDSLFDEINHSRHSTLGIPENEGDEEIESSQGSSVINGVQKRR